MAEVELTEKYLAEIAGWDVMKQARSLVADDRVLSGNWSPPVLKGVVQTDGNSLRAGLVFKSHVDVENLCPCRQSREWGMMCAHSIGIGLRVIQREAEPSAEPSRPSGREKAKTQKEESKPVPKKTSGLKRALVEEAKLPSLKLWFVFPPNWRQMLEQGKLNLFFEGETSRGRGPLSSVPTNDAYTMESVDLVLMDEIESLSEGQLPAMWPFDLMSLADFLTKLADHPRVSIGRKESLQVSSKPWIPKMQVTLEESGEIKVAVRSQPEALTWIPGRQVYVASEKSIQPMGLPARCAAAMQGELTLARTQVPEFLQTAGALLANDERCEANFKLEDFEFAPSEPQFSLSLVGGLAQLEAQLKCRYGGQEFTVGVTEKQAAAWVPDPESKFRYTTRNNYAESTALNRLLKYGFRGPSQAGWYELRGQDPVLDFFAREYPKLCRDWKVSLDERLEHSTRKNIERVQPRFEVRSSGMDWIDLRVDYQSDSGSEFSEADIQQWLLSGRNHRKLKNGKIAVLDTESLDEFREVLQDCSPNQQRGAFRMDSRQAGFLGASLNQLGFQVRGDQDWRAQVATLEEAEVTLPDVGHLSKTLRDYQKKGVAWLNFLRRSSFGGILADEMGLGKTLQVLALLESLRLESKAKGASVRALVVCPTSLVFNWVNEAKRFVPKLKVLALQGSQRSRQFDRVGSSELVITSYALIRRDLEEYEGHEFDVVVLDEAQHIKNRETQNARAVKSIKSRHKFVLTGTPMENSVLDLWSIFDFLMPGYLGSANDFRDRYEVPITKEKSQEVMDRLGRRLRPFVLRRTKREVAPELPEKLEQVVRCPLNREQREVYSQVMSVSRQEVFGAGDTSQGKQRMMILKALLRLRQICCDLRLLDLPLEPKERSGKLAMFEEILEEVLDGGHRVLVFSQFVSMLHLIRDRLEEQGIEYCYLDGSTRNREAEVAKFQGSAIPVFLISLKAGGVGLNLTGADTVVHFDPWWNPAIEDQATGRAHRIGQSRIVSSYKLIAEDSVEDKILQLQQRKREIIEGTLGSETQFAESLSMDDFRALFED
jgi:SNF2 family DNA or RNA helicase